ncbi:PREDICTED: cytochrome P450 87A3-like [Nelumbo nucifera]|uniref:Cytochrome P450 87A3-like n=1 Tax=Nelumbo nucifera TaxID=4432 RepID=A0A1U8B6W0_NELNU|nr:PREDICTED: cytochrome P450 87A3-like [Nelumbo nucifera]
MEEPQMQRETPSRFHGYGSLFKTSVAGRPVVISSDPEFNYFIINQEGKLVQKWYMDSLSKTTDRGEFPTTVSADKITKYLRNLVLKHFGPETLKQKLLPPVEEMVRRHLRLWSTKESVEVQLSLLSMVFDLTAKLLFNYETDITQLSESYVSQLFTNFSEIMMCFPLNIPGTALYRALKNKEKAVNMLKGILEERRRAIPNRSHGDILDHVIQDMRDETFLSDNFVATTMFSILSANIEPIATSIALAIILLTDHPSVLQELRDEHEAIISSRRVNNTDSTITWDEYKSMTFTSYVINETFRLANITFGILSKAIRDIEINGYTIPSGWTIMIVPTAVHLNPNLFEDPLAFNPWRWKDLGSTASCKNFLTFGGGMRACLGADYCRMVMAIFLHILVTNYRWTKIKGGDIIRTPILQFPNGFHIKIWEMKSWRTTERVFTER